MRHDNLRVPLLRLASLAVVACSLAVSAGAVDFHHRWWVGGHGSLFIHADSAGGGFRVNSQAFGARDEATVNIQDTTGYGLSLGYGVKSWAKSKKAQHVQMSVALDVSYISSTVGKETGFKDENASTRIVLPPGSSTGPDGDESYSALKVGSIKLMPVIGYALFHWGSDRADFYAGPGLGWIEAKISEDNEYRDFVGDYDGTDDVTATGTFAFAAKAGSNVRLAKNGRWYLYFEAGFYATSFVTDGAKIAWPGVDAFFGQKLYDTDGDGTLDTAYSADLRVVDPCKLRIDGATGSIGLRYRFGGRNAPADKPADAGESSGS